MKRILVVNGPNLNALGEREPEIYGSTTLPEIEALIAEKAARHGIEPVFFQSNHEGELIDFIQKEGPAAAGLIINPGAFTHYSYAVADAVQTFAKPVIEVHITNIFTREEWRHKSVFSAYSTAIISGLGPQGYLAAVGWLAANA